jgi:hypothetical protein
MVRGLVAVVLTLAASPARADVNIDKADALFAEGQKLKDAHQNDAACAKFKESLSFNPNGVGTMLNVAECESKLGHIGTAYKLYVDARDRATDAGLTPAIKLANDQLALIAPDVPYLAVNVADPSEDTRLVVNNQTVAIKADGTAALPVDPGEITVVVTRPGRIAFEKKLTVAKREHPIVMVERLATAMTVSKGRKRIGEILTIGGGAVAVAGVGIGLYAWRNYKNAVKGKNCTMQGDDYYCSDPAYSDSNQAVTFGSVGTWVGVGGLVVAGVGAYLWFSGPHDERLAFAPQLDPQHAGIVAFGRF